MIDTHTNHELVMRYSSGHSTMGSFGDVHVEAMLVWDTIELLAALAATVDPLAPWVPDNDTTVALFHLQAAAHRIAARLGEAAAANLAVDEGAQCREAVDWMDKGTSTGVAGAGGAL